MRIAVTIDGEVTDLDLNVEEMKLSEAVRLEEIVGADTVEQIMSGTMPTRPSIFQAIIYTKLKTQIPDLELDGFDLELGDLAPDPVPDPVPDEGKVDAVSNGE